MGREDNELYKACSAYMRSGDYDRALDCAVTLYKESPKEWRGLVLAFRKAMKGMVESGARVEDAYELLHQSYLLCAETSFDDFMIAIEWYRKPEEKFWQVRREHLLPICTALESLANDELDELFISCPPRIGKSTIVLFFTVWMMLKHPERSNLYSSYTEKVVKTFYNGCLEILGDHITYDISSVFPKAKIAHTDAADLLIDIGRRKKYPSLTARSVDGTLNGACDADQLVICDDLHSGIDEARSKDQLIKKWETVRANLLSRKKGNAKILWIGTRWSLIDCISNRIEMLETEAECAFIRHKVINVPALNEDGESNFDYMFHKGFTTADYKAIRASYETNGDLALWLAPYMGAPIERSGTVFDPTEMRYYNGELPKETDNGELVPVEPDRVYMVVDPAWGGGDYVAGAVCYQYGDEIYIPEVVYSNGDKSVTQPLIVAAGMKHSISALYIEATRVTASYAAEVDARFRDNGYRVNIQANVKNWNGNRGKQQRIFDKAPEIRERLIFLESGKRDKTYSAFMQNVFSFVVEGKNKHDDAPDCLAMIIVAAFRQNARIQVASAAMLDRF